jgi:hypothetical protein
MATITFNGLQPADQEDFRFVFASGGFDLTAKGSYETDDPTLIANAAVHPWLLVAYPPVDPADEVVPDPNDPHQTPEADHLSVNASPESIAAAEAAQSEQIKENAEVPTEDVAPAPAPKPVKDVTPDPAPDTTSTGGSF